MYPEIAERHQVGAFDDDFDRLLPAGGSHVAIAQRGFRVDGRVKSDVVGPRDVDTRHTVLVQLRRFGFQRRRGKRGITEVKKAGA